jgi:hypothetical protein
MARSLLKVLPVLLAVSLPGCRDGAPEAQQDLAELALRFCADDIPDFVAIQAPGGGWTRVTANQTGTFTINAPAKVGLVIVREYSSTISETELLYVERADIAAFAEPECEDGPGPRTLSGTVAGLSNSQNANVSMHDQSRFIFGAFGQPDFSFNMLPAEPVDLIASRTTASTIDRIIVRRGVTLASGSMPVLDFAGTEAVAPGTAMITPPTTSASEFGGLSANFVSVAGTRHALTTASGPQGGVSVSGVPSSLTQAGDVHAIVYSAYDVNDNSVRSVSTYNRNVADVSPALGAPLATPTISTLASSPSLRLRAQLASQTDYAATVFMQFGQEASMASRTYSIVVTRGFHGSTPTTWDIQMPDLSGVAGFPAASGLASGLETAWLLQASSASVEQLANELGPDGTTARLALRSSSASGFRAGGVKQPFAMLRSNHGRAAAITNER